MDSGHTKCSADLLQGLQNLLKGLVQQCLLIQPDQFLRRLLHKPIHVNCEGTWCTTCVTWKDDFKRARAMRKMILTWRQSIQCADSRSPGRGPFCKEDVPDPHHGGKGEIVDTNLTSCTDSAAINECGQGRDCHKPLRRVHGGLNTFNASLDQTMELCTCLVLLDAHAGAA